MTIIIIGTFDGNFYFKSYIVLFFRNGARALYEQWGIRKKKCRKKTRPSPGRRASRTKIENIILFILRAAVSIRAENKKNNETTTKKCIKYKRSFDDIPPAVG